MEKDFIKFLSQLSETNATLDFFVDFNKVNNHINNVKIRLNQLNYLIGQSDMKIAINKLYEENPKVFSVLGILIAVRKRDKKKTFNNNNEVVFVESYFETPELIYEFIQETGLEEIFQNKNITNLVDYVFGVEVGLDTNARKNRGGTQMENAVSKILAANSIPFRTEVNHTEFTELISLGGDVKRFDFVVKTPLKTYLIETNYYNSGGSKLNETARSYMDLAPKINKYSQYEFVWITDGQGWFTAKNKLGEAYKKIPKVYNLISINQFINLIKTEIE